MYEKLYLFVGEYNESYTGGSVVFVSTEKFAKEFEINGLKVVSNPMDNQMYTVRKFPGSEAGNGNFTGITPEHFWNLVEKEDFTEKFKEFLRELLSAKGDSYPGYSNKKIRVDWLPEPPDGIYIVYKTEFFGEVEDVLIISDTYYCS